MAVSERPRLLDLFCGAGGAAMGYHRAGFDVVGVDIKPQPNYPFRFVQDDAMDVLARKDMAWVFGDGGEWGAIHASPPCQAYTSMRHMGNGAGVGAPELIEPVRGLLQAWDLPYVIENVVGSSLRNPMRLCGSSFGLNVWRHRLFETSFPLLAMPCAHRLSEEPIAVYGDHPEDCRGTKRVRRARNLAEGAEAMGIDWMPWRELTQAIPPAMTEHIGFYLMLEVQARKSAQTPNPEP